MKFARLALVFCVASIGLCASMQSIGAPADGRKPLADLYREIDSQIDNAWIRETVYSYSDDANLVMRAWRTAHVGPALWVIAGLHGEEPAGPNAIAASASLLHSFAKSGVPVVLIPLANPKGYVNNWRYPNTSERDWRKGGYSVGDSEYLLIDPKNPALARSPKSSGPETEALTQYALQLAEKYPPLLVVDLHEDELSKTGGYIYSQGTVCDDNPVGAEIVRLVKRHIPLRLSGKTRFGETIRSGVISRDDQGEPIRDGSIDELLGSRQIIVRSRIVSGPAAPTVIVVETPAYAGARLQQRIAAHGSVIANIENLWRLAREVSAKAASGTK